MRHLEASSIEQFLICCTIAHGVQLDMNETSENTRCILETCAYLGANQVAPLVHGLQNVSDRRKVVRKNGAVKDGETVLRESARERWKAGGGGGGDGGLPRRWVAETRRCPTESSHSPRIHSVPQSAARQVRRPSPLSRHWPTAGPRAHSTLRDRTAARTQSPAGTRRSGRARTKRVRPAGRMDSTVRMASAATLSRTFASASSTPFTSPAMLAFHSSPSSRRCKRATRPDKSTCWSAN